jgi:hypothetical protein
MVTKPSGEWTTTTNGRELVGSAAVGGGEGCDDDMSASVGLMKKRKSPLEAWVGVSEVAVAGTAYSWRGHVRPS